MIVTGMAIISVGYDIELNIHIFSEMPHVNWLFFDADHDLRLRAIMVTRRQKYTTLFTFVPVTVIYLVIFLFSRTNQTYETENFSHTTL